MPINPLFDHYAHLKTFIDPVLRDVARNEAAPWDYRKFAVELLLNRRSPYANHTDLRYLRAELEAEMDGIQTEFPAPETEFVPEATTGPLRASVTTATMFGGEVVDMDALRKSVIEEPFDDHRFVGFDEVQKVDEPTTEEIQEALKSSLPKITPERKPRKPNKETDAA
jgi:hypothetical protein